MTDQPTFAESMLRCAAALKKMEELLYPKPEPVPDVEREDYKAYERWREDRAVNYQ
jgi:hypothetical protein